MNLIRIKFDFWLGCSSSRDKDEKKKVKAMKTCLKTQLVKEIQVFFGFANFYKKLIRN